MVLHSNILYYILPIGCNWCIRFSTDHIVTPHIAQFEYQLKWKQLFPFRIFAFVARLAFTNCDTDGDILHVLAYQNLWEKNCTKCILKQKISYSQNWMATRPKKKSALGLTKRKIIRYKQRHGFTITMKYNKNKRDTAHDCN